MVIANGDTQRCTRAKWLVAFLSLAVVLYAAGHERCCQTIVGCVLEGGVLGFFFGLLAVGSRLAESRRPNVVFTSRRVWVVVRTETAGATVVGLLAGLARAY